MAYTDVLVLGAGASTPYGFPTGKGLREEILSAFKPNTDIRRIFEKFRGTDHFRFDPDDCVRFRNEFWKAQTYSIDAFIERRCAEFEEIGKYAISYCLKKHESQASLLNPGDWYQAFFNKLLPNGATRPREFSVITFNYDRSLQEYLKIAMRSALGPNYSEGLEAIS